MNNLASYVGLNYVANGREYPRLDCWGLIYSYYKKELGIEIDVFGSMTDASDGEKVAAAMTMESRRWKKVERPSPTDIVLMKMAGWPRHVGMVIDNSRFIHAMEGHCSGVERFDSLKWARRVEGFYQWAR